MQCQQAKGFSLVVILLLLSFPSTTLFSCCSPLLGFGPWWEQWSTSTSFIAVAKSDTGFSDDRK
jgi:hypothetical protein